MEYYLVRIFLSLIVAVSLTIYSVHFFLLYVEVLNKFNLFLYLFRGNLNLTLLPSSDLRLSFVGDDGHIERLMTLRDDSECSAVVIDEIPADNSGRSFLVKIPDGGTFYFWCSEKSQLLGSDLLCKVC